VKNRKIKAQPLILHFAWVFLFLFHPVSNAQQTLVINAVGQPPLNTESRDGFMDEVTREAMKRIGYQLIIDRLPAERGLRNANNGLIDGEMSRIKNIDNTYHNLIRVPEKIMNWEFCVFSKKPIDLQTGWASLTNKNVAFINGWKILEKNVPKSAVITKTRDSQQLFTLLKRNRVDFIIYERWGGGSVLQKLQLDEVSQQSPFLTSREMFIYLHKKHRKLVPQLSRALADMKKDGSYDRLKKKHLTALLQNN
jgi:polar amino acid transport system substrate-binding protein